ncbi:MAG: DUF692 domain-containing protein, partial [Bacteroidota bacterium]|nr:DUF692 domain-containing protein [Bacteroidota bacterium]
SNPDLIQVIEIEPQTLWYRYGSGLDSFIYDKQITNYLKGLNKPLLFHGVGYPVGGSIQPDPIHLPCLKSMMEDLRPVWMSEHLSFNTIMIDDVACNTNFLLPPLQTNESVQQIAHSIKEYASRFSIPFAFETGVNYLSPKAFELEDGDFVNQIAIASEASVLLDIHNLLANELNGRQKIGDFMSQLEPEKVLQIHLAGGFYFDNYYLDAHSNVSSEEVLEVFEKIVKRLPNLKAITFEMLPDYLALIPQKSISVQLEKMNRIWEKRGTELKNKQPVSRSENKPTVACPAIQEWENTLGLLAINRVPGETSPLLVELENDKGLSVIKQLIEKFKGSLVVSSLKLSCRYIMLYYDVDTLNEFLRSFWQISLPKLFASDNGLDFADYLLSCDQIKKHQLLPDLIIYEKSSLLTLLDQQTRKIEMSFNPTELIPFLAEYNLPPLLHTGKYIIEILPEENYTENISTVFHS